jgi:hypothetical protein
MPTLDRMVLLLSFPNQGRDNIFGVILTNIIKSQLFGSSKQ